MTRSGRDRCSRGRAVAGARVEVLGDHGEVLDYGEIGEVCVRSPS